MGQELIKGYTLDKEERFIGGLNGYWKVYNAVKEDQSQRKVSVFIFEKKQLSKVKQKDKEALLEILRREAKQLAKFRHPKILNLVERIIENKKVMGFVTERVAGTL